VSNYTIWDTSTDHIVTLLLLYVCMCHLFCPDLKEHGIGFGLAAKTRRYKTRAFRREINSNSHFLTLRSVRSRMFLFPLVLIPVPTYFPLLFLFWNKLFFMSALRGLLKVWRDWLGMVRMAPNPNYPKPLKRPYSLFMLNMLISFRIFKAS
jgi:hypothetical protein